MELNLYNEAQNFWKSINQNFDGKEYSFDIEVYRKLTNVIHVGDFYYFIFNFPNQNFEYISEGITKVLGYNKEEINMKFILELIHPEDRESMAKFENAFMLFLLEQPEDKVSLYKLSYDIRFKHKSGKYKRILHQSVIIQHETPYKFYRSLNVQTDIGHIKKSKKQSFRIIGLDGEPSYEYEDIFPNEASKIPDFTKREREILELMIGGTKSTDISEKLFISLHTVNVHRKNILSKSECKSVNELILKAQSENWIS